MTQQISHIHARQVWDSRGYPTVEVEVHLNTGLSARAIAPAGASRGIREAVDLRDGGTRFGGRGVDRAVAGIRTQIADRLRGMDVTDQAGVDRALHDLDQTENFSVIGGNASTAVSLAVLHAAAAAENLPLWRYLGRDGELSIPLPEIQIFGGGAHAAQRVDIQDFMIIAPSASTVREAFEWTAAVYHAAGALMSERGMLAGTADEGGWWPTFDNNRQGLDLLMQSIERAGLRPGEDIWISLDIAASEFYRDGRYKLSRDAIDYDRDGWYAELMDWLESYPIAAIEDPFAETDDEGMRKITERLGQTVQIIGDDYLTTNAARVAHAASVGACNALLLKVNQAGTVSDARAAFEAAKAQGWSSVVSARSGETEDLSIVDLSVGWNAGQIKVGSFARSERMAKWNALLRIEEELGSGAKFAGWDGLRRSAPDCGRVR